MRLEKECFVILHMVVSSCLVERVLREAARVAIGRLMHPAP